MGQLDQHFLRHQERASQQLNQAVNSNRLAHALLFVGPQGSGKSTLSLFLAQKLLCTESPPRDDFKGCGRCSACLRVHQKSHPDLLWVVSERKRHAAEDGGTKGRKPSADITINDIRDLCQSLLLPPHEGRAKIAVIVDAHRMTLQAANALLKTLEEPRANTHLILVAPSKDSVLPTLRSRSQIVRFRPLNPDAVLEVLLEEGLTPDVALQRSQQSDGSVQQARNRTQLSLEETQFLIDLLAEDRARRVIRLAEWEQDRDELERLLSGMIDLFSHELHNQDSNWLPQGQRHFILPMIDATRSAAQRIHRHGNAQLVLEKLFLSDIPVFTASARATDARGAS